MRLLHTADWHLGHTLHDYSRQHEHRLFLDWLLETLDGRRIDALIVAGDIFDTVNPSALAQEMWYGFLARARRRCPRLDIVVVGGNHDSAARLDAPRPILAALDVFVVGGLPRTADRGLDHDRLLAPLRDAEGEVAAWVAAVPYLRIADLPHFPELGEDRDPLIEGVRQVYTEVIDAARRRRQPGQALLATGHCYMTHTRLSELSERRILGGNQHALPSDIFPDDLAYVALGHLHLPQTIGSDGEGSADIRYSGSPIPLSLSERDYPHQVVVVELEGEGVGSITPVRIPRSVDLLRVPEKGALPLAEMLPLLEALPEAGDDPPEVWPYLEVHIRLPGPEPSLRSDVEKALDGRRARLVRLHPTYTGSGGALGDAPSARRLDELNVEDVFLECWAARHEEPPGVELLEAFHELVEQTYQEEGV